MSFGEFILMDRVCKNVGVVGVQDQIEVDVLVLGGIGECDGSGWGPDAIIMINEVFGSAMV